VNEAERLRRLGVWFAATRVASVALGVVLVLVTDMPPGWKGWAWATCAVLAAGTVILLAVTVRPLAVEARRRLAMVAVAFDTLAVLAFSMLFSFSDGQPIWALFYLPVLEAALRFGLAGGIVVGALTIPLVLVAELFRASRFEPEEVRLDVVALRGGVALVLGVVVGRLATGFDQQARLAESRAADAERFRDALARRVDVLEAANRCARALGSSLELDRAFSAFIRELRGLVPFDRMAIVLAEDHEAEVIATAGRGADEVFPPGTTRPVSGSVLDDVLGGRTVLRRDMGDRRHPEEERLLELGLRCRLVAPMLLGPRAIGMVSLSRERADSFAPEEVELVSLLGRLVATAVQNLRAYEAERRTVEELRRLSTLRADFVSLVSHELRSPMAAVIGSARTLQQRWRQLSPEQRESFLALISDETTRLAELIADVLDTSQIEAGTFSYAFAPVDVGRLVEELVAAAAVAQDEVVVRGDVRGPLPTVRGDRERLRQVLANLIDNAIKYSPAGDEVRVSARAANGAIRVVVADRGPGVPREHQSLIFEKFGRAKIGGPVKPGTGLGLFIARSIAEAHGGTLDVRSSPGQGAAFTLALPAS
jgi:signal transduction histidine kinase